MEESRVALAAMKEDLEMKDELVDHFVSFHTGLKREEGFSQLNKSRSSQCLFISTTIFGFLQSMFIGVFRRGRTGH